MASTTTRTSRVELPKRRPEIPESRRTWIGEDTLILLICLVFLGIAFALVAGGVFG